MKKIYFFLLFTIISAVAFAQPLSAYSTVLNQADCSNNGAIEIFASGGNPPYTYALDGGAASGLQYITGLSPGPHTVLITDLVGATFTLNAGMTDHSVQFDISLPTDASCGGNDGRIELAAIEGEMPYYYSIDGINWQSDWIFDNLSPAVYTVYVKDSHNCTDSRSVIVGMTNTLAINAGPDVTVCAGSSIQLTATSTGSSPVYQWSPATGLDDPAIANPLASPLTTTIYTLMVQDGTCTGTDNITVTVIPATADAGADVTICPGGSTTLSGSGGLTYSWSPSTGLSDPFLANPIATPATTTEYILTTVGAAGCIAQDAVVVTIDQPVANAGSDVLICSGNSTTLSGSGGVSYNWSPSTGLSDPSVANPIATPAVTIEYVLSIVDATGCTAQDAVMVVIAHPVANAGPDVEICLGNSTTLSGSGGFTYAWTPSTGLSDASVADPIATPATTTEYVLTILDAAGCTAQDAVIVSVSSISDPQVSLAAGILSVTNPDGGASYTWQIFNSGNWEDIPGANGTSYTPTVNADYRVMEVLGVCTAYSASVVAGRPASTNPYGIYLYPNPATTVLRLDALEAAQNWETLEIINFQGRRVLLQNIANRSEVAISVAALESGIYIIRLRNHEGKTTTIRFLKRQ